MKTKSEFQTVLEKVLKVEEVVPQKSQSSGAKVEFVFDQNLFQVKFFKQSAQANYKQQKQDIKRNTEQANASRAPNEKVEVKVQPVEVQVEKIQRIKRKLNADQIKAVENFSKLGEAQINDESTLEEIKSAYRRLAKKYHPDLNPKGATQFKMISRDYKKLIQDF